MAGAALSVAFEALAGCSGYIVQHAGSRTGWFGGEQTVIAFLVVFDLFNLQLLIVIVVVVVVIVIVIV